MTPMVLFSGLLYQRSKIAGGLEWLAETSMVRTVSYEWNACCVSCLGLMKYIG